MLGVLDPRAHDLDPRADLGHGDPRAVLRDQFDDEVATDTPVAVVEEVLIGRVELDVHVHVAVVVLELDGSHRADGDAAAALHDEALRVVDAGERRAAAAVRRQRLGLPAERAGGGTGEEEEPDHDRLSSHPPSVPAAEPRRKSLLRPWPDGSELSARLSTRAWVRTGRAQPDGGSAALPPAGARRLRHRGRAAAPAASVHPRRRPAVRSRAAALAPARTGARARQDSARRAGRAARLPRRASAEAFAHRESALSMALRG